MGPLFATPGCQTPLAWAIEVVQRVRTFRVREAVYDQSIDKVEFPADVVAEIQQSWQAPRVGGSRGVKGRNAP